MRRHKSTGVMVPALWRYWSKMGLLVLNPTNVPSPTQLYALTQWCHFLRDFASLFISGFQYHFQVLTIVVGGGDGTLSCKVEVLCGCGDATKGPSFSMLAVAWFSFFPSRQYHASGICGSQQ